MTEEKLKEEMDKALKEVFDTDFIIGVQFELIRRAFEKGLELGMKVGKEKE